MNTVVTVTMVALYGLASTAMAQQAAVQSKSEIDECIASAAEVHKVNPVILRAILMVETRMKPNTIARNENGSVDVGIAGINSLHFPELAKWDVQPADLLDACRGIHVGAWHLGRTLGNQPETWESIARYHSATPYFNKRYQILLWNELVKSRAISGRILPVPPLKPGAAATGVQKSKSHNPATAGSGTGVVFDDGEQNK